MVLRGLILIAVVLAGGCTLKGQKAQPDFKRWSKNHNVTFDPAPIEGGPGALQVTKASISEVYTVLGNDSWTITVDARLENRSSEVLWLESLRAKFEAGPGSCGNGEEQVRVRGGDQSAWQPSPDGKGVGLAPGASGDVFVSALCSRADKLGEPFYFVVGAWRVSMRK